MATLGAKFWRNKLVLAVVIERGSGGGCYLQIACHFQGSSPVHHGIP